MVVRSLASLAWAPASTAAARTVLRASTCRPQVGRSETIEELPMLMFLAAVLSMTALWGARRHNRLLRNLWLWQYRLREENQDKLDAILGKHTQILALYSNPR